MDLCHLKNVELETKHQKYKGRVVLRGDIVKDDYGSYASIHRTRIISIPNDGSKSHGYHLQIARLRWTSSWRSICLYSGLDGRCSKIIENSPKSECPDIWIRQPRHKWPKLWSSWAKSVRSSFGRTVMGKAILESSIEVRLGEGFQLGMLIRTQWRRATLISVCGWHKNWLGRNKVLIRCGKYSTKKSIWENQHHFLDHV